MTTTRVQTPFTRSKLPLAGFFLFAGIAHLTFLKSWFEKGVPGWVPGTAEQVNVAAGVAELAGGVLVLAPGAEPHARRYLLALLLAVFPTNIQMAVAPDSLPDTPRFPRWLLWARLPVQAIPMLWVDRVLGQPKVGGKPAVRRMAP
jgi:uncharacterized membrane protein